jgi:hypothetical protein
MGGRVCIGERLCGLGDRRVTWIKSQSTNPARTGFKKTQLGKATQARGVVGRGHVRLRTDVEDPA